MAVPAIVTRPAPKPTIVCTFVIGWRRIAPIRDGAEGLSGGASAVSSLTRRPYGESPRWGGWTTLDGAGFLAGSAAFRGSTAFTGSRTFGGLFTFARFAPLFTGGGFSAAPAGRAHAGRGGGGGGGGGPPP